MIDLQQVYFGCADADTEADRNPTVFKKVFFDPHNYLNELVQGYKYIILGRKGDGKTAYSAQIKLIAPNTKVYASQRSLNNFNNTTFSQLKTYDSMGGNPYISFWKCVVMIECVRMIYQYEPNIQEERFVNIVDTLQRYGLLSDDNDISVTISRLVESNTTLDLKSFFRHGRKYERSETLQGAEQIYSTIHQSVKNLYLDKKFILIIDGLDDILNNSEFKSEIITGLIRATEEINKIFKETTLFIKIVILIRDDILNLCRDPNLSKIVRDSGIRLSWIISDDPYDSDLINLVSKRIDIIAGYPNSFKDVWNDIFPENTGGRYTLDYVLDNIIYRPRDILQFFIEAQKEFVPNKKFTGDKLQTILSNYSYEYFVDAMRDELTGFFPDGAVTILPDILSKMGTQYFFLQEFEAESKKYLHFKNVVIRDVLEKLFDAGYIGQHRPRDAGDRTVFSYRNPREKFQDDHECILHRGLMRALTI